MGTMIGIDMNGLQGSISTPLNNIGSVISPGVKYQAVKEKEKVAVCPNCKSYSYEIVWVKRIKKDDMIEVTPTEVIVSEVERKKSLYIASGDLSWNYPYEDTSKYIQVVYICKNCKYTTVVDMDKYNVADKL